MYSVNVPEINLKLEFIMEQIMILSRLQCVRRRNVLWTIIDEWSLIKDMLHRRDIDTNVHVRIVWSPEITWIVVDPFLNTASKFNPPNVSIVSPGYDIHQKSSCYHLRVIIDGKLQLKALCSSWQFTNIVELLSLMWDEMYAFVKSCYDTNVVFYFIPQNISV